MRTSAAKSTCSAVAVRGAHSSPCCGGHAAYRTQLFLYLKANGRDELNTFNLWGGIDRTMQAGPALPDLRAPEPVHSRGRRV